LFEHNQTQDKFTTMLDAWQHPKGRNHHPSTSLDKRYQEPLLNAMRLTERLVIVNGHKQLRKKSSCLQMISSVPLFLDPNNYHPETTNT